MKHALSTDSLNHVHNQGDKIVKIVVFCCKMKTELGGKDDQCCLNIQGYFQIAFACVSSIRNTITSKNEKQAPYLISDRFQHTSSTQLAPSTRFPQFTNICVCPFSSLEGGSSVSSSHHPFLDLGQYNCHHETFHQYLNLYILFGNYSHALLNDGDNSERCSVRQFCQCVDIMAYSYISVEGIAYYTLRLQAQCTALQVRKNNFPFSFLGSWLRHRYNKR